ncbi:hypothetical protein KIW84_024216 [Lathyrus oleraceus]|uniref:Uncharacterized protein n=1 Tax=Pisum sativum TaxID=3888 RepID=A0A9D5B932_PEA|nr:hypothetical protein KIW84_024216 [Pisum sativum]
MGKEADMSVIDYYTKFKSMFDELDELKPLLECNCEASNKLLHREEDHHVHLFLGGLDNEKFSQIKGTILYSHPISSLRRIFNQIQRKESHYTTDKEKSTKIEMSSTFYLFKTKKSKWKDNSKLKCNHCGKTRHIKVKCFEIVGYLSNYKSRRTQHREKYKKGGNGANFAQEDEKKDNTTGSVPGHAMHGFRVKSQASPHDKMTETNAIIDNGDREEATRYTIDSTELVEDNSAKISHANSEFRRHKRNK